MKKIIDITFEVLRDNKLISDRVLCGIEE